MRRMALIVSLAVLALLPGMALAESTGPGRPWNQERSVFPSTPDPWRSWGAPRDGNPYQGHQAPSVPSRSVWVPPQWFWNGYQWVWVPGYWASW